MDYNSFVKRALLTNPECRASYEYIDRFLDPSWKEITKFDFSEMPLSSILYVVDFYRDCYKIYPDDDLILNAFNKTPLNKVKVVIIGQDPYHEEGQANGLAFSVNKGVKLPPSLKNIFFELHNDVGGELRTNGDLSDWAEQGVLLLNTSLTVCKHQPNSMSDLWNDFTDNVIRLINKQKKPVIFVLWGNEAQKKQKLITNFNHYVITAAHPSPLSAYRGFLGSEPFSKINKILNEIDEKEIRWV